ncbi:MAG: hypothetical protein ACK5LJ_17680 [Paracoccus sp. (in: a-proteobacteria)]
MIGVVIWSSESNDKAVIWCEDQGPLAYLKGRDALLEEAEWPVPGDLLRLECETVGNLRHAHSVSVIAPKVCPQLPDALLRQTNRPASNLRVVSRNDGILRTDKAGTVKDSKINRLSPAINS